MSEPIRFGFGLHLHQPVGNVDSVFEQHLREVYPHGVMVRLQYAGLRKDVTVCGDGALEVRQIDAPGARAWRYPIETVAKSKKGFDRTVQGESVTLGWPVALGEARFSLRP